MELQKKYYFYRVKLTSLYYKGKKKGVIDAIFRKL